MTTGERLAACRKASGYTLEQVAKRLDTTTQAIYKYEKGIVRNIPLAKLEKMASMYGVTPEFLTGWGDSSEISLVSAARVATAPLFESVSAGFGAAATDYVEDYVPVYVGTQAEADETIAIRVEGDSMSPKIENGDLVQVWKTNFVESGSIAVVLRDTDAEQEGLVKQVVYGNGFIELHSLNDKYPPLRYEGAAAAKIHIVGLVRKVIKSL